MRRIPEPPPVIRILPAYALVEAKGNPFGSKDLRGMVYIANFMSTRCKTPTCRAQREAMQSLQSSYQRAGIDAIKLLTISTDPEFDTPSIIASHSKQLNVDSSRWIWLTGSVAAIATLKSAFLGNSVEEKTNQEKLILIDDTGGLRGYYDTSEMGVEELFHRSLHVLGSRRETR